MVLSCSLTPSYALNALPKPKIERLLRDSSVESAGYSGLQNALTDPEYLLKHWIELPTTAKAYKKTAHRLSLREAILLALRYNPNIQNLELDRVVQRYQLRLAHNEFELQYALGATGAVQKSSFEGVGSSTNNTFIASPEINLRNKLGTQAALSINNNIGSSGTYGPVLNFSLTQPLLRGFGQVNEVNLLNAEDNEGLNKLNLQQSVADQITGVITAYRALILSSNNVQNQRLQLKEAQNSYAINEKKIAAGQLEPTANIQQSYQIESLNLLVAGGENDFKTASQELLQIIGLPPDIHLLIPEDLALTDITVPHVTASVSQALSHNVAYKALKIALKAHERAYALAKNQQRWELDLVSNVQSGIVNDVTGNNRGVRGIYNGHNVTQTAQLNLTIPLHDLNRRSQLINAKIQLEKDRINLIAAKRALITQVTNAVNTIASLVKRYELAQKQVALARQSYELEKKKQQGGISTALDVNNTQNQLIQAQSGLISAKVNYLNQLSNLHRILGTTLDYWHIKLRYGG